MKNSSDFAALHAYLCADGYVCRNPPSQKQVYYRLGLRNTNETLLLDFQNKFEKFFGKKPHISKPIDRCEICSKDIYFYIINKYGSFKSREWNVLTDMDKERAKLWLRAFFDCESWIWVRKAKNRAIGVDSVNHKGLKQVAELLKEHFEINTSIRPRSNRDTATLCIYGKDQLIKFEEEIGFLHPFKKSRLREAIETYVTYEWDFSNGIKSIIYNKAVIRSKYVVYFNSIIKKNLKTVKNELTKYSIRSNLLDAVNGQGRKYYILNVYGKVNIDKLINQKLLSDKQIKKIKRLRSNS